MVNCSIYS